MSTKLGQNFLINTEVAELIVESLDDNEIIIEIGPGRGVLTRFLYQKFKEKLHLIEIDKKLIPNLVRNYPEAKIICQDVLKINFEELSEGKKINIIGNLPYCISTEILFLILKYKENIDQVVCMLQKEVVDRICAKNKTKTYGIPSVLLQAYFEVEKLFEVGPENFDPIPKVFSSVMKMHRNEVLNLPCNEILFNKVVHKGFEQRRKTLKNSLKIILPKDFKDDKLTKRAEELTINDFIDLTNEIEKNMS